MNAAAEFALHTYQYALEMGVAPEQARMILPQNMLTEWYWSGSLAAFARVCKLRLDPHAQEETRMIAEGIAAEMSKLFPVSWKELMG
jgi:thymidylate synthase (FAD)